MGRHGLPAATSAAITTLTLALFCLLPAGVVASRAASAATAQLRLLHAMVGISAVDVYVDGAPAASSLAFGSFSAAAILTAGMHVVLVVPTGADSSTATPLLRTRLSLGSQKQYTLALAGSAGRVTSLLVGDDTSPPTVGMARLRLVHLSPGLPAVDLALAGGAVLFHHVTYHTGSPYLEVSAQTATLALRPAGWALTVQAIDAGTLLPGSVYTLYAIGALQDTANRLRVVVDALPTLARLRVVHGVPGKGALDIYVDGQRAIAGAAYGTVSDYLNLGAGLHHIQVFAAHSYPAGVVPRKKGLIDLLRDLPAGTDYTTLIVKAGTQIAPVLLVDDNSAPSPGMAKVRAVALAWNVPTLDVAARAQHGLLSVANALSYGSASADVESRPGTYGSIIASAAGKGVTVATAQAVTLSQDTTYTVFVFGKLHGTPIPSLVVTEDQ